MITKLIPLISIPLERTSVAIKSFIFSDYEIQATVNSSYAYTTENYIYTIVLKGNKTKDTKERTIKSKGVATSILQKIDGKWKIIHSHTSFKKLKI